MWEIFAIMSLSQASLCHSSSQSFLPCRQTRSLSVKVASTFPESSVIPTFLTTQAMKFYKVVIARAIVPERQVVWDDLPI